MDAATKTNLAPQEQDSSDDNVSSLAENPPADENNEQETKDQFMSGIKLHILIFGLGLAVFLMALDMSIVVTAIPYITEKFQSTADIGWYMSGYLLTM